MSLAHHSVVISLVSRSLLPSSHVSTCTPVLSIPSLWSSAHTFTSSYSPVPLFLNSYHVDEKTPTISLFSNSKKLVQILLEFSQQIVEVYEFVLAKFS